MKLLIIVNSYPPDQRVSARRWGGLVPELQRIGVDCTVLAAGNSPFWTGIGEAGERVIRLPIPNRAPVPRDMFGSLGRTVALLLRGTLRYFVPLFLRRRSLKSWRNELQSRPELSQIAQDCDVVVASYGPMTTLLFGHHIALREKKPLVIDIRDSFQASEGRTFPLSRRISRFLERKLLAEAYLRITIGRKLAFYMAKQYRMSFHAVYNGWSDYDVFSHLEDNRGKVDREKAPYLYYAGTIYQHQLDALVLVLKSLRKDSLRLRIRVLNDNTIQGLASVIRKYKMTDRVDILPPVSSEEVAKEAQKSQGVLVLESLIPSELRDGTVTGKLFRFLASGSPGIAVCASTSEIQEIVGEVSNWHGASTVEECLEAINALRDKADRLADERAIISYHVSMQALEFYNLFHERITKDG